MNAAPPTHSCASFKSLRFQKNVVVTNSDYENPIVEIKIEVESRNRMLAAFIAGLVSFLSPCVLPLVPGYVSLISGASVDELRGASQKRTSTVMLNSIMFIAG